jgi:AraC-like DNA-binding protein
MPRTAAFTSGVLQELFRQLEYAPDETHRRQMDAAEQLLDDIQPGRLYPEDFIVFRITSYRFDRPGTTTAVVGDALRRDLVNFIQRLSWDLELSPQQARGEAVPMDLVAERLGVSRRTLQRCRRDGLVMHWVRESPGRRRLSCFPDALDRFLSEHGDRIASASTMRRMDHDEQQQVWTQAEAEVGAHPDCSLNEVALRIAVRTGRGHETIRRLLRRFNATAEVPLFDEHGPLTDRDGRLAIRFRRQGASWTRIAERFGKSETAVHRAVLRARRRELSELVELLEQHAIAAPDDLVVEACSSSLPHPARHDHWSSEAGDPATLSRDMEAVHALHHRAATAMAVMDAVPTVEAIDQVETWLRWAAMLHLKVVLGCWQDAIAVVEDRLQQPVAALPNEQRTALIEMTLDTICTFWMSRRRADADPDASIESMLSAELERRSISPRPGRASARAVEGLHDLAIVLRDRRPWSPVMPTVARLHSLGAESAADILLVERHFGLDGTRPCTLQELADEQETTSGAIARRLGRFQW